MKTILLLILTTVFVRAQNSTANITEDTKMELTKSKSSITLKAGTAVDVVGKEGDSIIVVYRKIQGRVPLNKTDFKGDVPDIPADVPKAEAKKAAPAPSSPAAAAKPADPKSAAPSSNPNRDAPTTNYGKMVKKARDNEAQHKENLTDSTNEVSGSQKK